MVARDVKVYAKGKHIYSRDLWVNRLDGESENRIMPRIGYDGSDNGMYAKLQVDYNLGPKTDFYADLAYYSKVGYKPMYGINHDERNFNIKFQDGWDEEDDEWIRKERDIGLYYKNHRLIDNLPLTYSAYITHGLWRNEKSSIKSWHTEYAAYLNHDRIYLFNSKNTFLDLTVGKKWVTESYTDETKSTMMYYATLGQKLAPKWDTWVGYYREDITSNLYDYGQPDMGRELRNGLSFKLVIKTLLRLSTVMIWANTVIMKQITDGRTGSAAGRLNLNMSRIMSLIKIIPLGYVIIYLIGEAGEIWKSLNSVLLNILLWHSRLQKAEF